MDRTRIKLSVYVDLDPTPGQFHSAESARNTIYSMLQSTVGHYDPAVSIDSRDVRATGEMHGLSENAE